jgi:hypothetical protein
MKDAKDVLIRATKEQILEFKESILWKDMKREMAIWRRQFERETLNVIDDMIEGEKESLSCMAHLASIHGRGRAIDFMIALPDTFLSILQMQKEDKQPKEREE